MERDNTKEENIAFRERLKDTFVGVAGIGAIVIGVITYYQGTTSLVWVTFVTILLLLASIYVKWHNKTALISCGIAGLMALISCMFWQQYLRNKQITEPQRVQISRQDKQIQLATTESPLPTKAPSPLPTKALLTALRTPTSTPKSRSQSPETTKAEPEPTLHPDVTSLGEVTGSVYDVETHSPIQGATIIAKNESTKAEYQTASRSDGHYSVIVPAGSYSVTVVRDGYIKLVQYCKSSYSSPCGFLAQLQRTPK